MAKRSSPSTMEAVDEYFDMLIKSRFNEMFDAVEKTTRFNDLILEMTKGPFGSEIKKSLFVPKSEDTYKVYIQANAIQKDETLGDYYITKDYFDKKMSRFEVHPGDYIVTCDGTMGKLIQLSNSIEPGIISASLLKITLDQEKILPMFFEVQWEMEILPLLLSKVRNGCLCHLPSAKIIGEVSVKLPDLEKQRAFVDYVYQIKITKETFKQTFQSFDDLVKSRFIEMIKSKGHPLKTIGDSCVKTRVGPFGSALHKTEMVSEGPVFVLGTDNAVDNEFKVYERRYISSEKYSELERYTVVPGDIIITMMGTIGRSAVIPENFKTAIISSHLSCLTVNTNVVLPEYLQKCMVLDHDVSKHLDSNKKGSIMSGLNLKIIKAIPFSCPPLNVQKEFMKFVEQVDKSKFRLIESLERLVNSVSSEDS